jgi:hypothetical protein
MSRFIATKLLGFRPSAARIFQIGIASLLLLVTPLLISTSFGSASPHLTTRSNASIGYRAASPNSAGTSGLFGASVAINGTKVAVGAPGENAGAGNVYLFSTAGKLLKTLTSPNSQSSGEFGTSVAIYDSTVVVGAPGETSNTGAAYIFSATTGKLLKTLISPSAVSGFGQSVAIYGTTVAVGAPLEAGFVSTFTTAGKLLKTMTSPNSILGGEFGTSVAIHGSTVVVGAPGETQGGQAGEGNAYTFSATTGSVTHTLKEPSVQMGGGGQFGVSVAISGTTIVVGAPGEYVNSNGGIAYTFSASSGALLKTLPNEGINGQFGSSVAITGTTAVVGAPFETVSTFSSAGSAYTFSTTTGSLLKTLKSLHPQDPGEFGQSVAIYSGTIVAGAPAETASGYSAAGNAYTLSSSTGKIVKTLSSPNTKLHSPNVQASGLFGTSVATTTNTIVVGAPGETASSDAGAGNVYTFGSSTGAHIRTLVSPSPQAGGAFGTSVAIYGTTIVVGAPGEGSGGNVYVFGATTGAKISTIADPNGVVGDGFGTTVAIYGTTVVVGAPTEEVSSNHQVGVAYSFTTAGKLLHTLNSPNEISGGNFGSGVAISGSIIVVGATGETQSGFAAAGNAYTFSASTGLSTHTLKDPNAQDGGEFGTSVAISGGGTIVVGAAHETAKGGGAAGSAYTFSSSGSYLKTLTDPNSIAEGNFGFSVAVSGTTIVVGAAFDTATGAGKAYGYSTSGTLLKTFSSPNPVSNGAFGSSVGIAGSVIVVGAPGETYSSDGGAGNAYIF